MKRYSAAMGGLAKQGTAGGGGVTTSWVVTSLGRAPRTSGPALTEVRVQRTI